MVRASIIGMTCATVVLCGCQTTDFAKSATPATIHQEFARLSMMSNWDATYVYGVGRYEMGYGSLGDRKGLTLRFDPGPSQVKVFYYGHRGGLNTLFRRTDVIVLDVDLKPNARYTLHCEMTDETARFQLIDLTTKEIVATSPELTVFLRPSLQAQPGFVPVFIPAHR